MQTPSSNVLLQRLKYIFNGQLQKGATLDDALAYISDLFDTLQNALDLNCLQLHEYNIKCDDTEKRSLMCQLFEIILQNEQDLKQELTNVNEYLKTVKELVGQVQSAKVKVTQASEASKFLIEAIGGPVGHIVHDVETDKLIFKGLIPIGTRMFINPNRVNDFDVDGRGKIDTDVFGFALRNGKNGTDNAFGQYVKYAADPNTAGQRKGTNSYTLSIANIKSFSLGVAGSITTIVQKVKPVTLIRHVNKRFGTGGARDVLIPHEGGQAPSGEKYFGEEMDLSHTHAHSLAAAHANDTPEALTIDLAHITELPIEFIGY